MKIRSSSSFAFVLFVFFTFACTSQKEESDPFSRENSAGQTFVNARFFGMDPDSDDNSTALINAIDEGRRTGLPLLIPSALSPYKVVGDIVLKGSGAMIYGAGGNAHLEFQNGGLIIGEEDTKNRGQVLRDLVLSRVGNAGPAVLVRTTSVAKHSRFTWNNIHILSSTGDGVVFEGSYLGAVTGLWNTQCAGTGIVFRPGNSSQSNLAGANALAFFGGETQTCNLGVEATDTKGIAFHGFAVEGNRAGGIWLHSDNRVFTFQGGYFENNAKDAAGALSEQGRFTDIRVGDETWDGIPNRNLHFDNIFFSDDKAFKGVLKAGKAFDHAVGLYSHIDEDENGDEVYTLDNGISMLSKHLNERLASTTEEKTPPPL